MKEIKLSQNKITLIDDEDFYFLNQYKWSAYKDSHTFYAVTKIWENGVRKTIKMHHLIIGHPPLGFVSDHMDGDGLNNQRYNLRFVTHRQSCLNRKNTSRVSMYPGVVWLKKNKKWQAQMWMNGQHQYLGLYQSEEEAFTAYMNGIWNLE